MSNAHASKPTHALAKKGRTGEHMLRSGGVLQHSRYPSESDNANPFLWQRPRAGWTSRYFHEEVRAANSDQLSDALWSSPFSKAVQIIPEKRFLFTLFPLSI